MKVLHVIPSVAPRYGGPSRAVIEMCSALDNRGMSTIIATTNADGDGALEVELGKPVTYQNIQTIFFPRQWTEAYKYSHPLAKWLDEHVAEFDLVHIHAVFSHSSLAAARACQRKGVPYLVRPLGTLDPWSLKQKTARKKLFWHLGVKQMLEGAAAIHYTTTDEQKLAEESLALKRGVVIPLGIETELFNQSDQREPATVGSPYVLVLSRLHQKKGLELLLPAFLSLVKRPEFSKWKLVLAGEGEARYVDSLKALAKSHGGNGNVVFAGWLDGEPRRSMLRHASLLALTSYQENFGLCAVEALACGVPVLLSPAVNIASEIDRVGGGWISALENESLERNLAESLGNEKERVRRGTLGRDFVQQHFTWESVANALVELYESVKTKQSLSGREYA